MKKTISILLLIGANAAQAQLNGHHSNGTLGLRAGSQPPEGLVFSQAIGYSHLNKIVDRFGNTLEVPGNPTINTLALAPGVLWVTGIRIFGAHYAVAIAFPFVNAVLESDSLNVKPKFGLSDIYLQPVNLGWHAKWIDWNTGFGLYLPTGRFHHGESTNYGLGMWTYELEAGFTIFPDPQKQWNIATAAWFELNSKKENVNTQVGNVFTLEGGIGHTLCRKRLNAGVSYGSQWKLMEDKVGDSTLRGKNRIFSLGPEIAYTFLNNRKPFVIATTRWLFDISGRSTILGNRLRLILSFPLTKK